MHNSWIPAFALAGLMVGAIKLMVATYNPTSSYAELAGLVSDGHCRANTPCTIKLTDTHNWRVVPSMLAGGRPVPPQSFRAAGVVAAELTLLDCASAPCAVWMVALPGDVQQLTLVGSSSTPRRHLVE